VAIELICRKIGMTKVFEESGEAIPVTVLEAGPNLVVQKKTDERDGYSGLQLGFGERREKLVTKPEKGHFAKAGVGLQRHLKESRISAAELADYEVGQAITCDIFEKGDRVDAIGTSKGRGYTGVVKRHNFAIKKRTHGTHEAFRHGGSIGAGSWPSKVIKGMKMPGQHGNCRVTVRNLEVVRVDPEQNLLFVRGAVPGHEDGIVRVRKAVLCSRQK
jgi:large subunit ribosomal protein L3